MENDPGKITKYEDGYKVAFERTFNHDIHKVWEAITDPEKLKFWFTDIIMDDFKPGGKLTILDREEGKNATHGEIVSIDRPNRFEYIWDGDLAVWELSTTDEGKCKLILTYGKIHPDFILKTPVGWHLLLDRLGGMLGGKHEILSFGESTADEPEFQQMYAVYKKLVLASFPELDLSDN